MNEINEINKNTNDIAGSATLSADAVPEAESAASYGEGSALRQKFERSFNTWAMLFCIIAAAIFLFLGAWLQRNEIITGLLATEFGIVLGSSLVYAAVTKQKFRDFFRLRSAKFSVYIKVFFMGIFTLPLSMILNLITIYFITRFGAYSAPELPAANDFPSFMLSLFTVAVSAGICEEMMFRGAMLSSFEKNMGFRKAAVFSALLFGMFHFNLGNLLSPIFLGLVFAYVTQVTGSIFPAMFGHFMNNAWAVLLSYLAGQMLTDEESVIVTETALDTQITGGQIVVMLLIVAAVAVVCGLAVRGILASIRRSYPRRRSEVIGEAVEERLDYAAGDYSLWESSRGRFGVIPAALLLFMGAVFVFLQYMQYFRA